jgi:hypothetical protein
MTGVMPWETQTRKLALRDGELHVWMLKTGAESDTQSLQGALSPDEVGRADNLFTSFLAAPTIGDSLGHRVLLRYLFLFNGG